MDSEEEPRAESKHGEDASEKTGAEGSKQKDNPGVDEVAGSGGEGDDQGGLGDRTGASGGATPTEPHGDQDSAERRR